MPEDDTTRILAGMNRGMWKERSDEASVFERVQRHGAENYDLGRADERIAVDPLIQDLAAMISESDPASVFEVLERARIYRTQTENCTAVGIERGWYPGKDS